MRQLASHLMGTVVPHATTAWLADVAAHAERVLNTCMGSSLSAPAYGVPGGAERVRHLLEQLPSSVPTLEAGVMRALLAHDRRIIAWRVRQPAQWGKTGLTMHLTGDFYGVQPSMEVSLVVQLVPSGHAQVRPA